MSFRAEIDHLRSKFKEVNDANMEIETSKNIEAMKEWLRTSGKAKEKMMEE